MITANTYQVKKLHYRGPFTVKVPGSKSITNRALMLAAMSEKKCVLEGVLFSDDSRAFLDCLM
ncbi:MAG: 3-phosphoshikimate 1-carboxyvinyltransferase, partial [Clostridia bacterium]|nr:3-phosphoshikimate 1-carboxyvinyltransferase [Clostridia bacterium]